MDRLNPLRSRLTYTTIAAMLVGAIVCVAGQHPSIGSVAGATSAGGVVSYGASWGGYGGYAPFYGGYSGSRAGPYLPDGWWTGYYRSSDPRGPAYNPDGGYAWESATTLLLETMPAKARVILNGIFIGLSDSLGPLQLPTGQHTLRVEAAGYEPSETVLKVVQPTLEQLTVKLTEVQHSGKPAPRK